MFSTLVPETEPAEEKCKYYIFLSFFLILHISDICNAIQSRVITGGSTLIADNL